MAIKKRHISRRFLLNNLCGGLLLSAFSMPAHAGFLDDIIDKGGDLLKDKEGGSSNSEAGSDNLSDVDAHDGLKEALRIATDRAVSRVGVKDGYFLDDIIHIRLPKTLRKIQKPMKKIGAGKLLDDVEKRLNRGAERAAPYAKDLFVDAIRAMTIEDAAGIVGGGKTSATDYFEEKMTPELTETFHPIMERELEGAGALKAFDKAEDKYNDIPIVGNLAGDAKGDLIDHGVKKALSGLFYYVGEEERAIRTNPGRRTTRLLKRVFG